MKNNGFFEIQVYLTKINVLAYPNVSQKTSESFELYISIRESLTEIILSCKKVLESDFNHIGFNFDSFKV